MCLRQRLVQMIINDHNPLIIYLIGFEGTFCEVEVDDCQHNKVNCKNGGFCIDLIDDYRCVCATGFTGPMCDKIDETVCDLIPNHVWRFNDTDCEKICVCQDDSKVSCVCQHERMYDQPFCETLTPDEPQKDVRVTFDSAVSSHSCHAIYAIHWLLSNNEPLCCHIDSANEVLVKVHDTNRLDRYITRTIFPHILTLVVSKEMNRDWSFIEYVIALVSSAFIGIIYCFVRARLKRRRLQMDAQNVVIHCIQNNLKPSQLKSTESKKMCNTLQYPCNSKKMDILPSATLTLPRTNQSQPMIIKSISNECNLQCKLYPTT